MTIPKALLGWAVMSVAVLGAAFGLMAATGFDRSQYGWLTLVTTAMACVGVVLWARWASR